MKIVLRAFGNKLSGGMEIPEDTGYRFRLAMTQPIQFFSESMTKDHPLMKAPINTICEFEWTGQTFSQKGHEYDKAREYQLVEISKW